MGVHDGGWYYRWATDGGVGQGGLGECGGEWGGSSVRRITKDKRHVSKTEWAVTTYNPMDDNGIVLASTSGDYVQSAYVCVCLMSAGVLMQ